MKTLNMSKTSGAAKQAGFTIIELVVVILLLGILTATALPRFVDVTDEAHAAAVDGVLGGFSTGVVLFRAQYEGLSRPTVAIAEFGSLFAIQAGTGRGNPGHLAAAAHTTAAHCIETFTGVLQLAGVPLPIAAAGTPGTVAKVGVDVENIKTATPAADWVVQIPTVGTDLLCEYYYTGNGAAVAAVIPVITYNPNTGSVVLGESAGLPD
jgi:MSHA pilin protein MshB